MRKSSIALSTITKNRFCHLIPPAWLRQTSHSTSRLCMGNIRFQHEKLFIKFAVSVFNMFFELIYTQVKKSGGIPPIPPGIPTGILEPPTWDPALNPRWDPANPTRDPSYILGKIPPIPHRIRPQIPGGIPPIPPGIPASFHAKSRQSHLATYVFPGWDPANPTWDPKFVPCEIPGGIPQSHLGLTCL